MSSQFTIYALLTPVIALIAAFVIFRKRHSRWQSFLIGFFIYIALIVTNSFLRSFEIIEDAWILLIFNILATIFLSIIVNSIRRQRSNKVQSLTKNETKARPTSGKPKTKQDANIFICYRRADSENIAGRIYDRLVQHYGKEPIFKDVDSIPLGVDFRAFLDEKVGQCQVLLVVIGNQWVSITDDEGDRRLDDFRDFVRIEIESALKRNIPVIPLLVRRAIMPLEDDLPSEIKGLAFRNGIQIRPDPDFHNDMERLISALDLALP